MVNWKYVCVLVGSDFEGPGAVSFKFWFCSFYRSHISSVNYLVSEYVIVYD